MTLFRYVLIALVASVALSSCASCSMYSPADCPAEPAAYGACFADMGYRPEAFDSLKSFCSAKGLPFDVGAIEAARVARLKKNCSTPEGVFTLSYRRYASGSGSGPVSCPDEMLTNEFLKTADRDGREAALARNFADEKERDVAKKVELEEHDDWVSNLGNHMIGNDSDHERSIRDESRAKSREILARYPKLEGSALNWRLKCSDGGLL